MTKKSSKTAMMVPSGPTPDVRRKPWLFALAKRYVRRKFARAFDGIHVEGLEQARALVAREPLILAATHVAWWDALFAIEMASLLDGESYCLMDADNLKRLPFFGWVGAVPLDRSSPKRALIDMKAAATLLDRPGRVMWIFPQGRQRPAHLRPLELQPGVRWLTKVSGARVLPMSLTYAFREAPEPAVLASFSSPIPAGSSDLLPALEERLVGGLERIDRYVDTGEGSFEEVMRNASRDTGVPLAGRLLSWFGRDQPHPKAAP
jgi:1-acyl-sn-glycerol-3-phosphate acyltransferase